MKKVMILNDREKVFELPKVASLIENLGFSVTSDDNFTFDGFAAERLQNQDAIILMRERTSIEESHVGHLGNIKLISQTGTGVSHLHMEALTRKGIAVTTTPGASVPAVVELTFGLIFSCLRNIHQQDKRIKEGKWDGRPGNELYGKRLGILGLGAIGSEVARVAKAFGAEVVAWRPSSRIRPNDEISSLSLEEVLTTSDIISIHLRSLPQFKHLLNQERFALMRQGSVLINTSRGALVDTSSLVNRLASGHIAAAGLDTFEEEPLPATSPLLQFEQVVCSPHIGWVTWETLERFALKSLQNIDDFFSGNEKHVLNRDYRDYLR